MNEVLGSPAGIHDGLQIAVLLDREADHRLAGCRDAVHHLLGPARFDADDNACGDVRVGTRADDGPEMQLEIFAELEAAIGMRNGHRALDVVGHGLAGRVRDVVQRQDDDMIAHTHPAIFTPIGIDGDVGIFRCHGRGPYQRLVLQLCVWT